MGKNLQLCCFSHPKRRHSSTVPEQTKNTIHIPTSMSSWSPSSSASIAFRNFNSLYDPSTAVTEDSETVTGFGSQTLTISSSFQDDTDEESHLDLSNAMASRRLLRPHFTGSSSSIVVVDDDDDNFDSVTVRIGAVPKCSPDPHEEFRKSMEEMVTALGLQQRQLGLQELLLCYLALNGKNAHKYIVEAFTNILRSLPTAATDH